MPKKKGNPNMEKLARRMEKRLRWFDGQPNLHKLIISIGMIAILLILIWKSSVIFWYAVIGWIIYAIGKKMIGKPKPKPDNPLGVVPKNF